MKLFQLFSFFILMIFLGISCSDNSSRNDNSSSDSDSDSDTDGDSDSDSDTDVSTYDDPTTGCTEMDLLFIVDDSGSMGCEQEMLTQAFPEFIEVIENYNLANDNALTYRVGVTSTGKSVNYTASIPGFPDLPMFETGMNGELAEENGTRWIDGPGDPSVITDWFSHAADLGTHGPSYEMPLQTMSLAILKSQEGEINEGFLRKDALTIIVIITDEDDCSRLDNDFTMTTDDCLEDPGAPEQLVPLQDYKDFLDDQLGGPEQYVLITIAGEYGCDADAYPTTCDDDDSSYAGAKDALRLNDFVTNYIGSTSEDNGLFSDICSNTMSEALAEALEKMTVACDDYIPVE